MEFQPNGEIATSGWGNAIPGARFSMLGRPLRERTSYWLGHLSYWVGPSLACLSLTVAGLAILYLGDQLRRLADLPGRFTGPAVAVALAVQAIRSLQFETGAGRSLAILMKYHDGPISHFWISLPGTAGYIVAIGWLSLAPAGRWTKEPDVVLKLARGFGWCWIALAVSSELGLW